MRYGWIGDTGFEVPAGTKQTRSAEIFAGPDHVVRLKSDPFLSRTKSARTNPPGL